MPGIGRIERNCALERLTRRLVALRREKIKQSQRLEHAMYASRLSVGRSPTRAASTARTRGSSETEDARSDAILKLEQFVGRSFEPLRPDRMIGDDIGQLSIDSEALPLSLYAPIEHITNVEFAADLAQIFSSVAIPSVELRAITYNPRLRDKPVMISSVIPSEVAVVLGPPDGPNGSTATVGRDDHCR